MGDPRPAASLAARLSVGRHRGGAVVVCDAEGLASPDLALVDALARAALDARRSGRGLVVRHASRELRELIALAGLEGAIVCAGER